MTPTKCIKASARVSALKQTLTDIIWSVTGRLQGLVQRCLLRKTKVGQFECCVTLLGGVQQIFRLQSARQRDFQNDASSQKVFMFSLRRALPSHPCELCPCGGGILWPCRCRALSLMLLNDRKKKTWRRCSVCVII